MAKKFVVLCHSSLQSQTDWAKMTYIVGEYNKCHLFYFLQYSQQLKLRGALHHWDEGISISSI